ncbi:MAG: hypothetical protein BA865_15140 [Desulfobacterales bacterium S5133MH4]|nr:MAG: hypothetical protein BA865_15140 [Desulfobacterales bacterium S5133MH4]
MTTSKEEVRLTTPIVTVLGSGLPQATKNATVRGIPNKKKTNFLFIVFTVHSFEMVMRSLTTTPRERGIAFAHHMGHKERVRDSIVFWSIGVME